MNSSDNNFSEYEDTNRLNTESSNTQDESKEQDDKNTESLFESQNFLSQSSDDDLMSLFASSGMLEGDNTELFNNPEMMAMGEEAELFNTPAIPKEISEMDLFNNPEMMAMGDEINLFATSEVPGETSEMDLFNNPEMMSMGDETNLFVTPEMSATAAEETDLFATSQIPGETSEMDLFNNPEMMSMGDENNLFATPEMMSMSEEASDMDVFATPEMMSMSEDADLLATPEMISMEDEANLFATPEMMSMSEEASDMDVFATPEMMSMSEDADLLATPEMISTGDSQADEIEKETSEIDLLAYHDLAAQTDDINQFTEVTTNSELDSRQQPEMGQETDDMNLGLGLGAAAIAAVGASIPLLEERLIVDVNKQKIGEIVVRKEIETEMIQVPVRREKLIVEQVGEETIQLAQIDLGNSEIQGVELATNTASVGSVATLNEMIVSGEFTSAKIASLLLNAIALERKQGCKKIRIQIVVDDAERQQTYQEWVDRCSIKPSQN